MITSLLLGAALSAPCAPLPRSVDSTPSGPPPWMIYLKANSDGHTQLMVYRNMRYMNNRQVTANENGKIVRKIVQEPVERLNTTYVNLDVLKLKFTTANGAVLSSEAVMKKAKDGLVVFASADGKPVSKKWLMAMDPDSIIVTASGLVSPIAPRSMMAGSPMAPRLARLTTAADGKPQIAYNPAAQSTPNGSHRFGNRVVFLGNGQQVFLSNSGYYSNSIPSTSVAPIKPLEKVQFEAYSTLDGKRMARSEALARLKAGGLVLVAGDNAAPDESYLKMFRSDLVVLVSPELLDVPTGTGKATSGKAASKPFVAPPIPLRPAILRPALVRPVLKIRAVPLKAAPLKAVPLQKAPLKAVPLPAGQVSKK